MESRQVTYLPPVWYLLLPLTPDRRDERLFNLKTLTIADLVQFKSMVLMYKIYNNLMPSNILSYFCMVHMSHDHDTRQAGHFKNMYCRTTLKSMCLSVRGPVMWNKLHTDLKNSTSVNMFKKRYKTFLVSEYAVT